MWHRVFCRSTDEVPPAVLAAALHETGFPVAPHFKGDGLGWTRGDLWLHGAAAVAVERFLTAEDGLRPDLNAFAAELEAADAGPGTADLMRRVIQTQQLITVSAAEGVAADELVTAVCQFFATASDGVVLAEGRGWFDATGALLHPETGTATAGEGDSP
jgi:hypothetical protein